MTWSGADRDHRVRRGQAAAQRGVAGRGGRAAGHPATTTAGGAGREVCLIPESAHGTNAASAVLAGLRVVVVKCGADGAIDLSDLRPSWRPGRPDGRDHADLPVHQRRVRGDHGPVSGQVHAAGGQVYRDGANLNALVGLATPGLVRRPMSRHLNLHKTFCIPHGGGGPGVGPVAVRAHLAEFLPGRRRGRPRADVRAGRGARPTGRPASCRSPGPTSRMMGAAGLRRATQVAVLSANYVAQRLAPHYPVLYTGRAGLVAHECVIDLRPVTRPGPASPTRTWPSGSSTTDSTRRPCRSRWPAR